MYSLVVWTVHFSRQRLCWALEHVAWLVKQLTHDRSGFFDDFSRPFSSLIFIRSKKERYERKQAIKLTEDNILIVGKLFDRQCYVPRYQQS
ncbi:hypothetical protein Y032_0006g2973 [Ancylostoma ceylanicum]|uniref:Uncharacterized protein n=1 Tax=Ancylostoma ceylanicum TaxID=53326 RepID=A0A016VPT6_9BILA|nr:hypothetical protein Y032_0006g2973 [Ancylostoma ceylanicum]